MAQARARASNAYYQALDDMKEAGTGRSGGHRAHLREWDAAAEVAMSKPGSKPRAADWQALEIPPRPA